VLAEVNTAVGCVLVALTSAVVVVMLERIARCYRRGMRWCARGPAGVFHPRPIPNHSALPLQAMHAPSCMRPHASATMHAPPARAGAGLAQVQAAKAHLRLLPAARRAPGGARAAAHRHAD